MEPSNSSRNPLNILMASGVPKRREGGVAAIIYNLGRELEKAGHQVTYVFQEDLGEPGSVSPRFTELIFSVRLGKYIARNREKFSIVNPAPLPVEIRTAVHGVIAQANEIQPGHDKGMENIRECHFAVVRKMGVAVQDAAILIPPGGISHGLPLRAERRPRRRFAREGHEPVIERAPQPEQHNHHRQDDHPTHQPDESPEPAAQFSGSSFARHNFISGVESGRLNLSNFVRITSGPSRR